MTNSRKAVRFAEFGLLAFAILAAGCLQSGPPRHDTPAPTSAAAKDAEQVLARLATPVKPDAARCLSDLEAFVALAPRRYENQFQHEAARTWLEAQLKDAGLQVSRFNFTGKGQSLGAPVPLPSVPGQDILGVLPGHHPDHAIVFGAHYDSANTAYGAAYDDGSGTLLVVELARAMAQYSWDHTLIFAEWDQEESGLVGSQAYVESIAGTPLQVDLALNFDMAGINWPAKFGGAVDVPVKADFDGATADADASLWTAVVQHLGQPASSSAVATTKATSGPSDHGSFLAADIPAAWVRGAVIGNYPMYHNADQVATMVADVGGDRAALVAGFDTVLQRTFLFAFVIDQVGPTA